MGPAEAQKNVPPRESSLACCSHWLLWWLHTKVILSTLAVVKDVAEPDVPLPTSVSPDPQAPIPRQIRYIIGNEGCERFSFYGMRNILTVFLVTSLLTYLPEADRASAAKDVFHTFVVGVSFFPMLGRWLADRSF